MLKRQEGLKNLPTKLKYTLEKSLQKIVDKNLKRKKRKRKQNSEEKETSPHLITNIISANHVDQPHLKNKVSISNSSSFLNEDGSLSKASLLRKFTLNSIKRMTDLSALKYFKNKLTQYDTKFKLPLFFSDLFYDKYYNSQNLVIPKNITSLKIGVGSNRRVNEMGLSSSGKNLNNTSSAQSKKKIKKKTDKTVEWNLQLAKEKILGITNEKTNKTEGNRIMTTRSDEEAFVRNENVKEQEISENMEIYNTKIVYFCYLN